MSDYDRALTVFSPDGHLLQVQYAAEAASRSLSVVAIKSADYIIILAERCKEQKLQDVAPNSKITFINDRVFGCFSGLAADARVLLNKTRNAAQSYQLSADEIADCTYIAKYIAEVQQRYTIQGGLRPFGVASLICGFTYQCEPRIYKCESNGVVISWKAHAIGNNSKPINEFLNAHYDEKLSLEDGLSVLFGSITECSNIVCGNVDVLVATKKPNQTGTNDYHYKFLSTEEKQNIIPFKPDDN